MRQRRAYRSLSIPTKGGFTLTDILFCIVIIAVLIAVLIPVFAKHHISKGPTCMSNMKQLGLALIGYTEDYSGKFPSGCIVARTAVTLPSGSARLGSPAQKAGRSHGLGVGWAGSTYEYVKVANIFKCPNDDSKPAESSLRQTAFPISYALNEWVSGQSQTVVSSPATTALAFECSGLNVNMTDRLETGGLDHSPIGDGASNPITGIPDFGDAFDSALGVQKMIVNNRGAFARHDVDGAGGGGSMYLLADGHVKFLRFSRVSVGERSVSQSKLGTIYLASFNPTD